MDMGLYNGQNDKKYDGGNNDFRFDNDNIYEVIRDIELENLIKNDIKNLEAMDDETANTQAKDSNNAEHSDIDIRDIDAISEDNHIAAALESDEASSLFEKLKKLSFDTLHKLKNSWNKKINITGANLGFPILFLIGTIIYLEIVTHIINYRSIDIKIIFPILFAIPLGLLMGFITGLFKALVNCILLWGITTAICLIFAVQLVYFYVFKVYFSFYSLGMAGAAVSEFGGDIFTAIRANLFGLILLFLPLFLLGILLREIIDFKRRALKLQVILFGSYAAFHVVALITLNFFGRGDYSPYDLYHNSLVPNLCAKELGITTMTRMDLSSLFGGKGQLALAGANSIETGPVVIPTEKPTTAPAPILPSAYPKISPTPSPVPIDQSPNVMDIDFNALAKKEKNSTIRTLDQYFASVTPSNKNEYTGMFKGYNLIQITAEGFSPFAVDKEKTPTLYKLTQEGFVFNNFYTALWQTSTSDGEYCALTGLIPTSIRNMYKGRKNLWPLSLGNQFDKLGIASKAYHDNTYTYYQRNETHPNLGYIFKAKGNGLKLKHPNYWPESDLEMIDSTVDEYINEKPFHVYYMTVSGHMNYTFAGNMMSYKNKALVEDMSCSDDVKAYVASQIELDKALEKLIKKLEEAGVADHTVIALSADHYPYAWDKRIIDEAAGHKVDSAFEIYRNKFILWCEGMDKKVVIDEPCSSLDILPTLSNLFGLEYDSRLLMGRDVLSDSLPLVVLSNRSFITDKAKYNAENGEVTNLTDQKLPKDYISNINKIVKNKFAVSDSILKNDYYRYIFK